ncbi:hypothetical protein L6E12_19340 [Actinokineospora sp. PR83]|uniref:hypothetical protein n=1 Tax=Actinokineospora sp. PR83 TaxID=2884908 RepID=UPI001F234520|nr:hypothetical protein [Actinokineospora sp. PR83]MCG8917938.1 hypothetical protein [Actinokineospora sp. PR83]
MSARERGREVMRAARRDADRYSGTLLGRRVRRRLRWFGREVGSGLLELVLTAGLYAAAVCLVLFVAFLFS